MKQYEEPKLEVQIFAMEDIMGTSNTDPETPDYDF